LLDIPAVAKQRFVFMLKTYLHDFNYVTNLLESFNKHNHDQIQLYIVVPEAEIFHFLKFKSSTCDIVAEELIPIRFATDSIRGIHQGYINQELVKLSFWKLGLSEHYLCLDSDVVFIRDFYLRDFMATESTPYSVLVEDRDLQADPEYYFAHWIYRQADLEKIRDFLNLDPELSLLTCHQCQIFSSNILSMLTSEVLDKRNVDFLDLLTISPYEFSWYNYFLQKTGLRVYPREPYFKMLHTRKQLLNMRLVGLTKEDLSRSYLGLVVNSSLSGKSTTPMLFEESLSDLLKKTISIPVLFRAAFGSLVRVPKIFSERYFIKFCITLKRNRN
jgi:hypothetical protein